MKVIGQYYKRLERKSAKPLTKNQLSDSAFHLHNTFFPEQNNKSIIAFCNLEYKRKVRKNYFLKILTKMNEHILVYSNIVPKLCSLQKRNVFYLFEVSNNGKMEVTWSKELPIKMNQCFNLLKVISSGQPGIEEAGLLVGKYFNIYTGGMSPKHYLTCEGMNPQLSRNFGLSESTQLNRDAVVEENIVGSDGTILIGGDKKELRHLQYEFTKHNKPYFHLSESDIEKIFTAEKKDSKYVKTKLNFIHWLIENKIRNINITGTKKQSESLRMKTFIVLVKLMSRNFPDLERANEKYSLMKGLFYETPEVKK